MINTFSLKLSNNLFFMSTTTTTKKKKKQIAATTLEEVVEMRKDIHKIETALEELRQIFVDMAVLVAEQGELLNDIRSNVDRATTFVHKGRKETAEARKISERSRKYVFFSLFFSFIGTFIIKIKKINKKQENVPNHPLCYHCSCCCSCCWIGCVEVDCFIYLVLLVYCMRKYLFYQVSFSHSASRVIVPKPVWLPFFFFFFFEFSFS